MNDDEVLLTIIYKDRKMKRWGVIRHLSGKRTQSQDYMGGWFTRKGIGDADPLAATPYKTQKAAKAAHPTGQRGPGYDR